MRVSTVLQDAGMPSDEDLYEESRHWNEYASTAKISSFRETWETRGTFSVR